jgi:fucose 4-O-acetylase-like acetyltransferase
LKSKNHTFISTIVALVAAGIPISTISAHELNFLDPVFLITWCFLGIVGAFGTFLYFNLEKRDIIGTFVMGYMLAVTLRFVIDVIVNNVAHSNLSFSLLLAMAVGGFTGWAGSELWVQMKKGRKKKRIDTPI